MAHYLFSMKQPVGIVPPPEVLAPVMEQLNTIADELKARGAWVFGSGLHQPDRWSVVRNEGGHPVISDGPYAESTEFMGGAYVLDLADLDDALEVAGRIAAVTGLPIEVAPFQG